MGFGGLFAVMPSLVSSSQRDGSNGNGSGGSLLPFVAGATSATLLWATFTSLYVVYGRGGMGRRRVRDGDEGGDENVRGSCSDINKIGKSGSCSGGGGGNAVLKAETKRSISLTVEKFGTGNAVEKPDRKRSISFSEGTNKGARPVTKESFIERLSSRIGELPSSTRIKKRMRWPWDRIRRTVLGESSDDKDVGGGSTSSDEGVSRRISSTSSTDEEDSMSSSSSSHEKSGLCIGSIFGLDVGGTLAKLVYFEQQLTEVEDIAEHVAHPRQHLYHRAASAQTVLLSRRGVDLMNGADDGQRFEESCLWPPIHHAHTRKSEEDLRKMYQMRQASVPDNLNEFAETCHIPRAKFTSKGSMQDILLGNGRHTTKQANGADYEKPISWDDSVVSDMAKAAPPSGMKRSRSMFDISKSRDHAEALDRFYNFARRLDAYETGVKDKHLSFYSRELGGEFHFIRFETRRMESAMELIRVNNLHHNIVEMGATGGGAHKFADDWERVLGIEMAKQEELDSLVAGMQFVLADVVGECYTFKPKIQHKTNADPAEKAANGENDDSHSNGHNEGLQNPHIASWSFSSSSTVDNESGRASRSSSSVEDESESAVDCNGDSHSSARSQHKEHWWSRKVQCDVVTASETYPYLLVTIGTGVSILRVDGPRQHERISGSSIGGGTYWGLCRLLTDVEDFEDVLNLAQRGDPAKVDMMVGDIYGKNSGALEKLGLPSHIVASSFGKLVAKRDPAAGIKEEDLAIALLLMITNNIGQVAYLNAQLHKTPRIYFVGNFLRQNIISQQRLAYAINYWSGGEMEALFLEHEGYFGALGAFLLCQGISHGGAGSLRRGSKVEATEFRSKDAIRRPQRKRSQSMGQLNIKT